MERRRFPAQTTPRRLCHRRWHYFNSAWYQYSRKRWTSARCSTLGPPSPPVAGEERSPPTSRGAAAPPYRRSRRSSRGRAHPSSSRPETTTGRARPGPATPGRPGQGRREPRSRSCRERGDRRPRPGRRSRLPLVRELSSSVPETIVVPAADHRHSTFSVRATVRYPWRG